MPGDIYGFIGHNGAGKTTTIKCVTGILPFEQGEIYVDGHSVKEDPVYCKSVIAYIPVSYTHLDVYKRQLQMCFGRLSM